MKATIEIFGKKYSGEGDDVASAIGAIEYKGFSRTRSVLTVGEKVLILPPFQTSRLFSPSVMVRGIAVKQITQRFS